MAEAVDRLIARLAARYFGLVTHAQLVELGLAAERSNIESGPVG